MFKIHKDAKKWGAGLISKEGPIKTQFDIYYLSFLVGIGLGRSENFEKSNVSEITRTVTEPYIPYRYIIAGLLMVSELKTSGFKLNKKIVKNKVSELLDSRSPTLLSDEAVEIMNRFAYSGFEAIREKMPKPPYTYDFLIWFHNEMLPDCFDGEVWND